MTGKSVEILKSSEKWKEFLEDAKILFGESKRFEALIKLNQSLCFAENDVEIGECCGLRARIFFEMENYEKCLGNIKNARKSIISDELKEIEKMCIEKVKEKHGKFMKNYENFRKKSSAFFKLSYPANPRNPAIIDCLKLQTNDTFGRHLITTRKINAGDIVIIEKPLHQSLDKNFTAGRCVNCFDSNLLDLMPCDSCTSVMFCSEDCRKLSWEKFHKYECDSIDELTDEDNFLIMIQRTLFEVLSICGGLEKMEKFFEENQSDITAFDVDLSGNREDIELKKKMIMICQSLECAAPVKDDLKFAGSFVDNHHHVKKFWETEDQRYFLVKFVVKFLGIMNRNAFTMHLNSPCDDLDEQGCAIFPTISLINHSCSPNLFHIRVGENLILVAKKPIEANEQLFIAYQ